MNPGLLYWGTLVLAVAAGAGIMAVIELFRGARAAARVDPVTKAAEVIANALGPLAQASATIPPGTAHRNFDTLDVYQEGVETGRAMAAQRGRTRPPRNDDSNGQVSGPGPEPGHPYPFPAGIMDDPLDTRRPWITDTYPTQR